MRISATTRLSLTAVLLCGGFLTLNAPAIEPTPNEWHRLSGN